MTITNNANLPEALVKACETRRHNDPGRLSATTLLQGTKQILLTDRHWDELTEDVADRIWAIFGTAGHKTLEHEGENDFTEEPMSSDLDGIKITGRIDNYNMKEGVISDYKFVKAYKITGKKFDDWRRQGLIYAWLLIKNGFEVKKCQFIALIKDHSKWDAKRNSSYPQEQVYVYSFDVTPEGLEEIEAFIKEKIAEYKRCRELADDDIPPCSPEERWDNPTTFAVKKEGNKKATKANIPTLEEAEKIAAEKGKGFVVEERPGASARCAGFCSCCGFCNFYRDNVAVVEEESEAEAA